MSASPRTGYADMLAAPEGFPNANAACARRLSLVPFAQGGELWEALVTQARDASAYHGPQWRRILESAYGLSFRVALLEEEGVPAAGCILARTRNPFSRRLIALPFSDYCPPLALRPGASTVLLDLLAAQLGAAGESCELRGTAAPAPWKVDHRFSHWALDLRGPAGAIEKTMDRNFRRQIRRAREAAITLSQGSAADYAKRFYALHLENRRRLGLPAPPWRFFRSAAEVMGGCGSFEVWLASGGGRDLGSVVLLKDRDRLHCKWSARTGDAPAGTMQLLFWEICARYAGEFETLDLGRTDDANDGLSRFKREMGAAPAPLPYAFYPNAPAQISSEHLTGPARALAAVWRRLPAAAARVIGAALYGYLA
jgi:hypothetical protein